MYNVIIFIYEDNENCNAFVLRLCYAIQTFDPQLINAEIQSGN